ncbi:MAG: hypothetical protein N2512_00460 [Armatimonadetes bacterium]|nr:hypothetical protein [Armatimonadota bacterium]
MRLFAVRRKDYWPGYVGEDLILLADGGRRRDRKGPVARETPGCWDWRLQPGLPDTYAWLMRTSTVSHGRGEPLRSAQVEKYGDN